MYYNEHAGFLLSGGIAVIKYRNHKRIKSSSRIKSLKLYGVGRYRGARMLNQQPSRSNMSGLGLTMQSDIIVRMQCLLVSRTLFRLDISGSYSRCYKQAADRPLETCEGKPASLW